MSTGISVMEQITEDLKIFFVFTATVMDCCFIERKRMEGARHQQVSFEML